MALPWRTRRRRAAPTQPPAAPPGPRVTGRACVTCAVTWRSAETCCRLCGRPGELSASVNMRASPGATWFSSLTDD